MIKRRASAQWQGSLKDGKGTVSAESGTLKDTPYSFKTRFESGVGTNPEELIAAAHAGCFTMAFSLFLGNAGFTPDKLETTAELLLEAKGGGFAITKIHLVTRGTVPNITPEKFLEVATEAKKNCPVSQVLNAEITLDAALA